MLVTVLKAFDLFADGMTCQPLVAGDVADVPDHLYDGLHTAGHIDDGAEIGVAVGAEIAIPEGWADLGLPQLKALAKAITGDMPANKAKAIDAVKAELARREAA